MPRFTKQQLEDSYWHMRSPEGMDVKRVRVDSLCRDHLNSKLKKLSFEEALKVVGITKEQYLN